MKSVLILIVISLLVGAGPDPITKNLKFVGSYSTPDFLEKFNEKHLAIHGTLDNAVLRNKYSAMLKRKHINDRHGTLKLVRTTCGFATISGARKGFFVNNANNQLARAIDIRTGIVGKSSGKKYIFNRN